MVPNRDISFEPIDHLDNQKIKSTSKSTRSRILVSSRRDLPNSDASWITLAQTETAQRGLTITSLS